MPMIEALKELTKQPYWAIALILGVALIAFPSVTIDKDYHLAAHSPTTLVPVIVGLGLLVLSAAAFWFSLPRKNPTNDDVGTGLDLTRVKEKNGIVFTTVSGCEIRVVVGRLEDCDFDPGTIIVLPCNEYFDDRCAGDTRSALGAYVNRVFEGQVDAFISLVAEECTHRLGPGIEQQKTDEIRAMSYGPGKCILLSKPLNRSTSVALVSTTTQRAGQGLVARISYLFDGMRELVGRLADARFTEVAMPVLAAGYGRIDPPLALVGLLLAVAEAARYGQGGQRLRRVTIVVFKSEPNGPQQVDDVVIRRALALIGSES